jgi:hypothetical protein
MANPSSIQLVTASGAVGAVAPQVGDQQNATLVSEFNPALYQLAYQKRLFQAHAIVTAPVIYTTAAGTGGPLIWNGAPNINVVLLKVGLGISVVTTVAASLGITGNSGQTAAPTSTTAIDSNKSLFVGSAVSPQSTAYRVGTPSSAGNFFLPFADLHTGALTVDNLGLCWVDLGGSIIIPPNSWASIAASATATTTVMQASLIYAEIPI